MRGEISGPMPYNFQPTDWDSKIKFFKVEKKLANGFKDVKYFCGTSGEIDESGKDIQPTYRVLTEPEYHSISETEANALLKKSIRI